MRKLNVIDVCGYDYIDRSAILEVRIVEPFLQQSAANS